MAGMAAFLQSLQWGSTGLLPVIVQHIDTGAVLMQATADRAAISETLQTGMATFRSHTGRWGQGGEAADHFNVHKVFPACNRDAVIYLSSTAVIDPGGPTGTAARRTCWYPESSMAGQHNEHEDPEVPATTLYGLERTIEQRLLGLQGVPAPGSKPGWTSMLLHDPELLCQKVGTAPHSAPKALNPNGLNPVMPAHDACMCTLTCAA